MSEPTVLTQSILRGMDEAQRANLLRALIAQAGGVPVKVYQDGIVLTQDTRRRVAPGPAMLLPMEGSDAT